MVEMISFRYFALRVFTSHISEDRHSWTVSGYPIAMPCPWYLSSNWYKSNSDLIQLIIEQTTNSDQGIAHWKIQLQMCFTRKCIQSNWMLAQVAGSVVWCILSIVGNTSVSKYWKYLEFWSLSKLICTPCR